MQLVTNHSSSARQAGEQRYRHLFEHMPICIFVVDVTARPATLVAANRRAELVYGYTAAELMGMPVAQLAPADARPTIQSIVHRVRQG